MSGAILALAWRLNRVRGWVRVIIMRVRVSYRNMIRGEEYFRTPQCISCSIVGQIAIFSTSRVISTGLESHYY